MMKRAGVCIVAIFGVLGGSDLVIPFIGPNAVLELLALPGHPSAPSFLLSAFWYVTSLCLMAGSLAILTLNGPQRAWRQSLGIAATVVTLLGLIAFLAGSTYVLILLLEQYACFLRYGIYHG